MMDWIKSLFVKSNIATSAPVAKFQEQTTQMEDTDSATATDELTTSLFHVLKSQGRNAVLSDLGITLPNGLVLRAEFLDEHTNPHGNVRTVTRTFVSHPHLIPEGLAEFQHATGKTPQESVENGFRSWIELDLATIEDAITDGTNWSLAMSMEFPATETSPALKRKVYMGPYIHHVNARQDDGCADGESHTFCPCCLFTNSIEAFRGLLNSSRVVGIRLYAARNMENMAVADCRVNGEDFPTGAELLRKYVESWPELGFEFRKQYVVIRSADVLTG